MSLDISSLQRLSSMQELLKKHNLQKNSSPQTQAPNNTPNQSTTGSPPKKGGAGGEVASAAGKKVKNGKGRNFVDSGEGGSTSSTSSSSVTPIINDDGTIATGDWRRANICEVSQWERKKGRGQKKGRKS